MKILDRYLLRSFIVPLAASLVAFLAISIIVDLFERLDTFIDNHVSFSVILEYYLAKLQFLAALILPISSLIATLFSLGGMARRNELVAMTASGIGLSRILRPVLLAGLGVSLLASTLTIEIVPRANEVSTDILDHEIRGRPRLSGDQRVDLNYLGAGGRYFLMRAFDGTKNSMSDVVVQQFAEGTLVRRIDARRADWKDGTWLFHDGFLRTFFEDGHVEAEPFKERAFPEIQERPHDFLRPIKEPNEMPLGELLEHTKRARLSGGDVTRLLVEKHRRIAFPFANFVVVLLGAPLTGAIRRGGHTVGFAAALLVGFLYYVLLEVGGTFGLSGQLPPIVAAWLPNIVFIALGIFGLAKTRK